VSTGIAVHEFEVPDGIAVQLRELGETKDAPLSTVLTAAFAVLLHRYSCEGTLTVRTTSSPGTESLVRLVPASSIIPGDLSFAQVLDLARTALKGADEGPDWRDIEILAPDSFLQDREQHGPKVAFRKTSGGLTGSVRYRAEAFEEILITRLAGHLQAILRTVAASPSTPISKMRMLGEEEQRQILIEWNQTDCEYPQQSAPELVEKRAEQTPHAVALIQGDRKLTYRQLNEQANRLANHLRAGGVRAEAPVGLCMEQSLKAVVSVLGILKAGGAYVPLDPCNPQSRLAEIASDARLSITVTSAGCRHRVPPGIEMVCVDQDALSIAAEDSVAPESGTTPDSAAYILYTSASTGKPKGVVGIHRSITNGLNSVTYVPDEVCCLNTFLSFGFSIANLFLPLMSGVPLVVLSNEQIRDTNQMMMVLEKEGVTRIVVVPAVLKQILAPDFKAETRLRKITTIGVAGGKLTPDHFQRLAEAMPQAKLQNRYASTEIGTVAAIWDGGGEITIGRPVANTRMYILDRYMNPVPAGVAGELYVGAAHLAREYLNRPDLTAERFLPDPFSARRGERIYRTGDSARFRSNGEIEFIGRTDDQVKINGFRMDLAEVERALADHRGVSDAVVMVREVGGWQRLVAYVVTRPIGTPSGSQLRAYLRERLPGYMVPSKIVFLEALPMNSNGKLERRALPMPEPIRPKLETVYEPPGSPMEAAIAQIWSDLLGLDPIGVHDKFLDLGGDSLMAAQVAVRLSERFGLDITPEVLADEPTVAKLAMCLAGPCLATQTSNG
jgi:amino acid adenylation domain-containing protein